MLKQSLQQKLLQKLSPQQIQMIKLLEVPAMQLEQRVKKELEDNPALDEGAELQDDIDIKEELPGGEKEDNDDDFSIDEYVNQEIPSYKLSVNNYSKDDKKEEIPFSVGASFHDSLTAQLGLRKLDQKQETLANYIIGNIDDDGYLRRELDAIVDDVAFSLNIDTNEEELHQVLTIIQEFEPAGVGARDLRECLLIQLRHKKIETVEQKTAYVIVNQHFREFTRKHYDKIMAKLDITDEDLKDALEEIVKLNPRPGGSYSDPHDSSAEHIIPDFILDNVDGELQLSLNAKNVPELRVNRNYADMLEAYVAGKDKGNKQQRDAVNFMKQKLDSAKWFIDAIKQRQNTLLLTMNAILDYQYEYFIEGDETKLRPMILKDIAEATNLDISTISRVANSKHIQTHFGMYSLKYFFSEGLTTDTGEEVSTREIKTILRECISGEDKHKPLTDDKLAAILKEKGYQIARRTVAKYREQLDIPVARMRKEI